nr:hypothetical protein [Candidatus Gracilibacteria bacterium]
MSLYRYALSSTHLQDTLESFEDKTFKGLTLDEKVVSSAKYYEGVINEMDF